MSMQLVRHQRGRPVSARTAAVEDGMETTDALVQARRWIDLAIVLQQRQTAYLDSDHK